jgi:hypothetical protein
LRGLDLNQRPSGYESETATRSSPTLEGKAADSETSDAPAHSGHRDHSDRLIMITPIGHGDRSEATLAFFLSLRFSSLTLIPWGRLVVRSKRSFK